jgi:mRNA-degrading endonuclease toxin of MazEF toxin-antitoxin module
MNQPRGSLVLVDLEPTRGHEQRGTRPCLVDQLRSIDKQRIRRRYGQVSDAELAAIDAGLCLYLGLVPDPG